MKSHRGLSFDPNTHHTGVAFTEGEEVVSVTVIHAKDIHEMANNIRNFIFNEIDTSWIAVEGYYLGKNFDSAVKIGHLVMCVQDAAAFINLPCFTGSAMEINKALGIGPGRKRKPANMEVARCMGFDKVTQDEADAIAVSVWGWGQYKNYIMEKE